MFYCIPFRGRLGRKIGPAIWLDGRARIAAGAVRLGYYCAVGTDKISPKIDFVFRKLFGSDENKDLLISLIDSVIEPAPHIVEVTIKNPFNLADYVGAKETILDIEAVDQDGVWYDIEMQIEPHVLYGRRALYYLSKTYADQLEAGQDYSHLNTTIGIHFLDFKYFEDERILRQFVLKEVISKLPGSPSD